MSSYSTSLKLELMDNGSNSTTWGTVTNTNLGTTLEQAIVGKADITMSSATITLSLTNTNAAQNARAIYLNLTGSPGGAAVLEVPAVQKPYIVKNGSDQQVTIKVTGLTGVVIPVGKTVLVYNNGTDVVTSVDHIPSLTLGAALPVASGGTGITAFGTGVATALGQNVTGSGGIVLATSPTLTTPNLGTPSAATLSNATGLPIDGGTTGTLPVNRGGTGATTLTGVIRGNGTSAFTTGNVSLTTEVTGTLPVANGGTGVTTSTGTGSVVLSNSPALTTPNLGTPSAATLTNATGLPIDGGTTGTLPVNRGGTGATTLASGQFLKGAGTSAVTTSATVALGSEVSGTLPVANGGTGATSLTANNVLLGNGTSAVQVVAPSTNGNILTSNGTTWTSAAKVTVDTIQTTTSGSTKTFSGIPSTAKVIYVMFNQVRITFAQSVYVRVGDSSGVKSTSYRSAYSRITNAVAASGSDTSGILIPIPAVGSSQYFDGMITLSLFDTSNFQWSASGVVGANVGSTTVMAMISGLTPTMSSALDRIEISASGGATFDVGSVNISYF